MIEACDGGRPLLHDIVHGSVSADPAELRSPAFIEVILRIVAMTKRRSEQVARGPRKRPQLLSESLIRRRSTVLQLDHD